MMVNQLKLKNKLLNISFLGLLVFSLSFDCTAKVLVQTPINKKTVLHTEQPLRFGYQVKGSLVKRVLIDITNPKAYGNVSLYADDILLIDNLNIPKQGRQQLNALVKFKSEAEVVFSLRSNHADLTVHSLSFEDINGLPLPFYKDISVAAGLDKVSSIKYGGPTIADLDGDGDYDFIVNNHNEESSKIYWNNGNGTVSKHHKNLSRWNLQDLHGTAAGDYDNDGDLDLVLSLGGGNGKNPSKINFYENKDGEFLLMTGDVNIDKGGRGRGANWSDMDLDGDLDLMLINETSLYYKDEPQHLFYENLGNSSFEYKQIAGLEMKRQHRSLVTDINNDNIDDVILYGPLSLWLGNGDFTFTDATSQIPQHLNKLKHIMAVTDIDIDNDGDLDLYVARGKEFEHGFGETPWVDMDEVKKEFSFRSRGYSGVDEFEFKANGPIQFYKYYYLAQGVFRGQDYPIFLGSSKTTKILASGDTTSFAATDAQGWPEDISQNGIYLGHIGEGRWKAALVRNGNVFWGFKFSLLGVNNVSYDFTPQNRNESDLLLRNDGGKFTDVTKEWNIPLGANSLGVTSGDFNNDSQQDLLVYRWGLVGERISDYMLLNNNNERFELLTMHGASDEGGPGHGDMGQSFDFDLDGDLDLLSGSENGEWYIYANETPQIGNYVQVRVGYSPELNIDAIAAEVTVKTPSKEYRKRVGSAGSVFSQSLLNIVHFGLGSEEIIEQIEVKWRNGETALFESKMPNKLYATDRLDPSALKFASSSVDIREGASKQLSLNIQPNNADKALIWSSSQSKIVSVDNTGKITAHGNVNDSAVVTATSRVNGMLATVKVNIVEWFDLPIRSVSITPITKTTFTGQSITLEAQVFPNNADDNTVLWSSSDNTIASVDANGVVRAKNAGKVSITASSQSKPAIKDTIEISVEAYLEPSLRLVNEEKYLQSEFEIGKTITIEADYHAGSGNKVIASDEGGMRFWLRHFKKGAGIAGKDYIVTNTEVLGTRSGKATTEMLIHDAIVPSADLPEGHYYMLRVSFTNSQGVMLDKIVSPISIVKSAE